MSGDPKKDVANSALATVDKFFDGVYKILQEWAPQVQQDISAQLSNGPLNSAQLAQLVETESINILTESDLPIYGAGFCAAEKIVDQGNPLAWWQGPAHEPLASSTFGVGPGAVDLRRLEWYRVPEISGEFNIAGPFVDYLCSNEVTITSSLPLTIGGHFAGVLCLDVLVSQLEESLLPKLQDGYTVTLMNANRRVVFSTDNASETGDKLPQSRIETAGIVSLHSQKYPFVIIVG